MNISLQKLRKYSLLKVLSESELIEIKQRVRTLELPTGAILILEGQSTNAIYFVLDGWLKAEKVSREGRQQTLRFIGPGEIINELSVFSEGINYVSVIALEPAHVFSLPQTEVEKLLAQSPSFSKAVIEELAQRIHLLLNQIENLSLYSVEVRLARFLLEEAEEGVVIRQAWKTQSEIAAKLGTVLDVVNRNLQKLATQGYIEVDRDQIKIIDPVGLKKIAQA